MASVMVRPSRAWVRRNGVAVAMTAAAIAASVPSAKSADLQKVRMSMAAQTVIYAPYLIAMDKGYYADEGLEIDVQMAGGGVATPAQIAGTIDINTSGPVALSPILRGAALKRCTFAVESKVIRLQRNPPGERFGRIYPPKADLVVWSIIEESRLI